MRTKVNKSAASKKRQPRSPEEAARRRNGIVYFIQDFVTRHIKIGFCIKAPEKRLAALQTGNANALRLLGHLPGTASQEKHLHKLFADHRVRGEWFAEAIVQVIADIMTYRSVATWLKSEEPGPVTQQTTVIEAGSDSA